ncbi:MAG: putative zinc-binding metallopeptidase [Butyricimonas faecihominis]
MILLTEELTELDLWMQANFTKPYNIEVLYKWLISSRIWRRHRTPTEDNAAGWLMY